MATLAIETWRKKLWTTSIKHTFRTWLPSWTARLCSTLAISSTPTKDSMSPSSTWSQISDSKLIIPLRDSNSSSSSKLRTSPRNATNCQRNTTNSLVDCRNTSILTSWGRQHGTLLARVPLTECSIIGGIPRSSSFMQEIWWMPLLVWRTRDQIRQLEPHADGTILLSMWTSASGTTLELWLTCRIPAMSTWTNQVNRPVCSMFTLSLPSTSES